MINNNIFPNKAKMSLITMDYLITSTGILRQILTLSGKSRFFTQNDGLPIGAPLSPSIANIYMKYFEEYAIKKCRNLPLCGRNILYEATRVAQAKIFLDCLNNLDTQKNGVLP